MKTDEQMVQIAELESCVEKATLEADRRMTQQQQEYEHRVQLLMKQLAQAKSGDHSDLMTQIKAKESRLKRSLNLSLYRWSILIFNSYQ